MWSPVCWCPKGYSLTTEVVRKLLEGVLDRCKSAGLHVPCCSFDGQWHNISVRTVTGEPLILLQLQKDVWKEALAKPKNELETALKQSENTPQWRWEMLLQKKDGKHKNTKKIICTNGGHRLPETPKVGCFTKSRKRESVTDGDETEKIPNMTEVVSEKVIGSAVGQARDLSVLQCQCDAAVAKEIATCNIQEDEWAEVLQDLQREEEDETVLNTAEDENESRISVNFDEETVEACSYHQDSHMDIESISSSKYKLNNNDFIAILALLKSDKDASKKGRWDNKSEEGVNLILHSKSALNGARNIDIRVIARYLKKVKGVQIKEYDTKAKKIETICEALNISQYDQSAGKASSSNNKKKLNPKSLATLSYNALREVRKSVLNVIYAEYIWPQRLKDWQLKAHINPELKIEGIDEPDFWFYVPEFVERRQQLEVKCIDSTHLLTRTRRKTCHGGIEGLDNKPWLKVAKQGQTFLTPIMVEDIIDPMSMSMAVTHFSKPVQKSMRNNNDFQAASLCECVSDWWRAEDDPGIEALERINLRLKLRRRLLRDVRFDKFPPPSSYVKGWPCQLWEALVAGIDAKALLYALTKSKTYNTRAFSSMMGETFFAELTNQDKGCHGTVTAEEFGRYISRTIEQMQMRLDTERLVEKSELLPQESACTTTENERHNEEPEMLYSDSVITSVYPRNHFFDSEERKRLRGRNKEGTVSRERNAVQKGSLGVRWEKARRNESKMLISKRMGLELP